MSGYDVMQQGPTSLEGQGIGEEEFNLEDMTEEDLQQLVQLGVIDEQMAENARQMMLQEKLRYQAMPEGRQAGRTYVAANPLEHLSTGVEKYQAAQKIRDLEAQRAGMEGQQTAGRATYWDLLRGRRKTPMDFSKVKQPIIPGL